MSNSVRIILSLCAVAFLAACAAKTEEVVYTDQPVTAEPEFEGKYGS
jgi:outer membrane biogenesis lipoprotein LolB